MRHLSEHEVVKVVTLIEEGEKIRGVARRLNVSPSVVSRVYNRYLATGSFRRRPGQGRKRKTTAAQDRFLISCALRRRVSTARDLQSELRRAHGLQVCSETVRKRLCESNLRSRRPLRKPRLTVQHKVRRLAFAREHADWTIEQWSRVLFSDESRFRLTNCDGRLRVWARPGERYRHELIQEYDKFGKGSVMMWAGITSNSRTQLVQVPQRMNAARYIEDILANHVVPAAALVGREFVFQQDNARPHSAAQTQRFLQDHEISVMVWPALSPDLNPIEHLWDQLDKAIRNRQEPPETLQQLAEALEEEWLNLPQENIQRLIESMPRRCQAVIQARGGHTRY